MFKNLIPFLLLIAVLGFSCTSDEYEVIPETTPEAPVQEEQAQTAQQSTQHQLETSEDVGPTSCEDCDYVISPNTYKVDNSVLNLPAGSKIGIKGQNRSSIYIVNFRGTAEKPFVFVNCDGPATITSGSVGIKIHHSSFIRVSGTGSSDEYGIKVSGGLHGIQAEKGATNYEIDHIEIFNTSSIGFPARSNPEESINRDNFVQRNTWIHDNYIHDVGNEGIYIGGSHWQNASLKEPELKGVRVYNNRIENTGYDGLQVGSAVEDTEIYNNTIINFGLKNVTYHQAGLMINPGTTGKIYNNWVQGGAGHSIFLTGFGNTVYNNIVVNGSQSAFYIADRAPLANQSYRIFNNTIVNVAGTAVKMTSTQSVNNTLYNNVVVNAGSFVEKATGADMDIANNFEANAASEVAFVDHANFDFTPTANSPLVDAGRSISSVGNILMDYLLYNRIAGASIDIGAYEYQK